MNKAIATPSETRLRVDFDDAADVGDFEGAVVFVAPLEGSPWPVPGETEDPRDARGAQGVHAAKSDDRCLRPKVRAPYVRPEIVSGELVLKRFNPCDP